MLKISELRKLSKNLQADPEDYMNSFRENIRMYIDVKEITLAEVAELADMPESTLKSFIYGKSKDCHLSTAVKLARVFQVSVDELVGAGTISPQTCESLQIMRQLPVTFTHYVRYAINLHYRKLTEKKVTDKAVEITKAEIAEDGSMRLSTCFDLLDISGLSECVRNKVFMGLQMPSDLYEPFYFEGDLLLIANDRAPRDGENVLVSVGDRVYVLKVKIEKVDGVNKRLYYSIRDGKLRSSEDRIKMVIGYIVKVILKNEGE